MDRMANSYSSARWLALALLITGILLLAAAGATYAWQGRGSDITATWSVTVSGPDGAQKTLSFNDIKAMTSYTGRGGFFTTTGVINGPYEGRGVTLEDLCALVGGLKSSDIVKVSASDGYSTMLDYAHIQGGFITYDPVTLKEKEHGELKPILMYQQDGAALTADGGKPLRLAVVGRDGLLTEGLYWIKWINKIEIIAPRSSGSSG
jgi:DMSO/TMAO reductase YedYZ molybdopterin-dependent catalytic subunit